MAIDFASLTEPPGSVARALSVTSPIAATSTPVTASLTASQRSPAFTPQLGRAIVGYADAGWTGTLTLQKSRDGGSTWVNATLGSELIQYAASFDEEVDDATQAGVVYAWLASASNTGTANVGLSQ